MILPATQTTTKKALLLFINRKLEHCPRRYARNWIQSAAFVAPFVGILVLLVIDTLVRATVNLKNHATRSRVVCNDPDILVAQGYVSRSVDIISLSPTSVGLTSLVLSMPEQLIPTLEPLMTHCHKPQDQQSTSACCMQGDRQ
jgi:hypothetical protein